MHVLGMRPTREQIDRALLPAPGQERIVHRGFWDKVRRTAARLPFLDDLVAAYFAALDPATPATAKAVLWAALAYFVVPSDLIPDVLGAFGFTDDLAVLLAVYRGFGPHITESHRVRARAGLAAGR